MQCARRYPEAPTSLGRFIQRHGNVVGQFMPGLKILSFPVKHNWWEKADPELIRESAKQLVEIEPFIPRGFALKTSGKCYLPWPGCGNGQLQWKHVSGIIRPILDDRFVVVEYDPETV